MGGKNAKIKERTTSTRSELPLNGTPSLEFKVVLSKFTRDEISILSQLFRDLSSRSQGLTVDKVTFLQFFPLPGLWGERLFDKFDKKNTSVIDFEEFMSGLRICTKGDEEEKIKFLFSLYDLRGNGHIDRTELLTMLHNTY
jgi:Ca2+-binding EF-hand superfamily protein